VYVTLGTTPDFNERPGIFEAIIKGLRREQLNVIVTIGRNQDPARFGHMPKTIRVTQYIPQTMLLSRCTAVICHGGSGTLTAAIVQGLPMVILPIAADQLENGERCASAGFARVIAQSSLSPQSIRQATLDVITAPAYRVSAERARDECAALPEITRGVHLVEQLVNSNAPIVASE
jgi:MGT family glycosyltransferase